jgi:carbonic anhydrase/acetyltransferase-like protein (isoleucine patch superfamily)
VIINSGAVVEHDCRLGDWVHISPRACLGGNVTVEEGAWVGIGAVVKQGVTVGRGAIVGAGRGGCVRCARRGLQLWAFPPDNKIALYSCTGHRLW